MSNLSFADFAATLQAAQTAIDDAPRLTAAMNDALRQRDDAQQRVQDLELRIRNRNDQIDTLHNMLEEVTLARDTFRIAAENAASQRDRLVQAFSTAASMVEDEVRQIVPPAHEDEPTEASAASAETAGAWTEAQHGTIETAADPVPVPAVDPGPAIGDAMSITPTVPTRDPNDIEPVKFYPNGWLTTSEWDRWADRNGVPIPEQHPQMTDGKPASQSIAAPSGERLIY